MMAFWDMEADRWVAKGMRLLSSTGKDWRLKLEQKWTKTCT